MKDCFDPASFRDQESRILHHDKKGLRVLNEHALKNWQDLISARFFQTLTRERKLVRTECLTPEQMDVLLPREPWTAMLEHEVLPFISYPHEWCFGMLKDAAIFHLELILTALEEDMALKDCSAYNVQWMGVNPIFIDISSFRRFEEGEPWLGYRQFCQMFLYPLFLQAFRNVPFQPWLRGCIDGITPEDCLNLMSLTDLFRPGVFVHTFLMAKAQQSYGSAQWSIRQELKASGFSKRMIKKNVENLLKIVRHLSWRQKKSSWAEYESNNSYTDLDKCRKESFVREAVRHRSWNLVWNLGCNNGTFSQIVSQNANCVVAMDADALVIERLYQNLKHGGSRSILPLVINIADIAGGLGWPGLERRAISDRGKPDLILCLALAHHLVVTHNIPPRELLDWLSRLSKYLIVEFVSKEDPMTQHLLRNKEDNHRDYDIQHFEEYLTQGFSLLKKETLSNGTRTLYFVQSKSRGNS